MANQNFRYSGSKKVKFRLNYSEYFDFTLSNDESDFDLESVFSSEIIGYDDYKKLPLNIVLNDDNCSPKPSISLGSFVDDNTIVSDRAYPFENRQDDSCYSLSGICDVGLTGIDNGLTDTMTGQTLYVTNGTLSTSDKFKRLYYDKHFKMISVTGHTDSPNVRFSGISNPTAYNIVSNSFDPDIPYSHDLYGGFYQGFYKLFQYDYQTLPERYEKGWTMETVVKPRINDLFDTPSGYQTLNEIYPQNAGIFFYMGTRAEDKFYHYATGYNESYSAYTRVTEDLSDIKTCSCAQTAFTSDCYKVYPISGTAGETVQCYTCGGCDHEDIVKPPKNPKVDTLSNSMAIRFSGDSKNPKICVRVLTITGSCLSDGDCTDSETYTTGGTFTEICSDNGIYDNCINNLDFINTEKWLQVNVVFERYKPYEGCDLVFNGGIGDMSYMVQPSTLRGDTLSLIKPPYTHEKEREFPVQRVVLNREFIDGKENRLGELRIYLNGYLFMTIENFEEIIPRPLDTEKEKQIAVPYNISWGGGTQGLRENLTFESLTGTTYQQDPELFPDTVLSSTTLSDLSTDILLEKYFAGTFEGRISEFRLYSEPLNGGQIQHNNRILKETYQLFNFFCPDCNNFEPPSPTPTPSVTATPSITPTNTPTNSVTPTNTPTSSVTQTPTVTSSPSVTPSITVTPSISPEFFMNCYILYREDFVPPSKTPTPTPTTSPTITPTPSISITPTVTQTPTSTQTPSVTTTPTNTQTPTISVTPSETPNYYMDCYIVYREDFTPPLSSESTNSQNNQLKH